MLGYLYSLHTVKQQKCSTLLWIHSAVVETKLNSMLLCRGSARTYISIRKKQVQNVNVTFAGLTHPAVGFVVALGQQHLEQFYQSLSKFTGLLCLKFLLLSDVEKHSQWTGCVLCVSV